MTAATIGFEAVPLELRGRRQWVVWKLEQRDGKATKVPYRADGCGRASSTDPGTWATFEAAVAAAHALDADGIGYVFSASDPFVGLDLDAGLSEADRGAVLLKLNSYAETSVSGQGSHVIVRANLNGHGRNRRGPFEVYESGRYFCVTGKHLRGTPTTIEARQAELEEVLAHFLPPEPAPVPANPLRDVPLAIDDEELLERARTARNGEKFQVLWAGQWESRYGSQSEADSALCGLLGFWTGRDPSRVDSLFRRSGLMRSKWDSRRGDSTYGAQTIERALAHVTDVYEGSPRVASGRTQQRSESSRPGRDAVGTRSAASPGEMGETAIASPRPDVVGTRDGTRSLSPAGVSLELRFVPVAEFVSVDEPGADALVGGDENVLIAEGAETMFYGDGGAGKTTMMLDLALHLAAGDDWLGIRVGRAVRVGVVENEGPRPLFRKKLARKLRAWAGSPVGDRLLLLDEPWAKASLDDEAVRTALAAKIAEHELDVLLVGPVTRSGMNEAGTLQHVRDYANLIGDVRAFSGRRVAFLLAHHENRGGQVSGAWEGAVDTLFHVQAQGHGQTRLFIQKARWSPKHHKMKLQLAWAEGEGFEVLEDENRDDNMVADEILAFVREHGGTGWNKVDETVPGKGNRLRTIRDGLLSGGRLVNAGSVARMKLWHADDPALPVAGESLRLEEAS